MIAYRSKVWWFYILLLLPFSLWSQDIEPVNGKAREFYTDGEYVQAAAEWKKLLHAGFSDPDLFANIAHAESMSGNIAESILYYEKALRLRPFDQDIQQALMTERDRIENAVIPVKEFFILHWIKIFLAFFRPSVWALGGLVMMILAVIYFLSIHKMIALPIRSSKGWKIILPVMGVTLLLIALLSYNSIYRENEGIIMNACDFREAPTEESPLTRLISAGEKVMIRDHLGDWVQVRLLNLDQGWIRKDCLQTISPKGA
jgi:hypothetical protein